MQAEVENNDISGVWVSKETGEIVNVSRFVIDGNDMVIVTKEGKTINGNDFSNNWYKISNDNQDIDEIVNQISGIPVYENKNVSQAVPIKEPVKPNVKSTIQHDIIEEQKISDSEKILNKIFKDCDFQLDISVKSLNIPLDAIDFAVKYLEITKEEINTYISKHIHINLKDSI